MHHLWTLITLVLCLLCISTCAARYHIYAPRPLAAHEAAALSTIAVPVSSTNDTVLDAPNSLWLTPDSTTEDDIAQALSTTFVDVNGPAQRRRKRYVQILNAPDVLVIDVVQPVSKGAVASWGIDRVDERPLPLSNSYTPDRTGAGVTAWVVDTGLEAAHVEFGGRAQMVFSTYDPPTDCDGHGTHVSGTIGGATVGVAHAVQLRGVKVLNCQGSGTTTTVAQGLQYVYNNRAPNRNVINMSLGYGSQDYVIAALIQQLYAAGVTMVAAAGNDNGNGCTHFPAAHAEVISVAASTINDQRSSFSNFGSCVELFAPGSSIVSAHLGGGTTTLSGTSMASPHVAGAVALLLQNADMAPAPVANTLLSRATVNVIGDAHGTPNRLLFVLLDSNPPQPGATTTTATTTSTTSSTTTSSTSSTTTSTPNAAAYSIRLAVCIVALVFAIWLLEL